jgi:nucleoside-diphosphate-sugar epimerase
MKRICVTGSSGFIGKHLVQKLKQQGRLVIEISRAKGIDISDWETLTNIEPCDVIVHLAAKTFVPDSFDAPRSFYATNLTATLNAMELARQWNARVILMSSYFYGPPQYLPVDEKHPLHPHNPYAQTKLISENIVAGYCRDFDLSAIALRLFNVYGPGQSDSFLIPTILRQVKRGHVELKDPRPKRDFIHIYDVVSAICSAIDANFQGFHITNLGTGTSYSVEQIVDVFIKYWSRKFTVQYSNEYRPGEVLDSVADNSKTKELLGWENTISIEQGIQTLIHT